LGENVNEIDPGVLAQEIRLGSGYRCPEKFAGATKIEYCCQNRDIILIFKVSQYNIFTI
jgi:hypothetical protein